MAESTELTTTATIDEVQQLQGLVAAFYRPQPGSHEEALKEALFLARKCIEMTKNG